MVILLLLQLPWLNEMSSTKRSSAVKSSQDLIQGLKSEGLVFKSFILESVGEFHTDDVDWNYKDMLHAKYVHKLIDPVPVVTSDYTIAQLFFQKFLIFRFPYLIYQYDSGPNELTYFFSLLNFVIVVNTKFHMSGLITTVKTTYNIGSNQVVLKLCFPLIKWALTRNYRALMSDDMPMRLRRGELRRMGAHFKKAGERYSFLNTVNIAEENCQFPDIIFDVDQASRIKIIERDESGCPLEFLTGQSDAWGLRGVLDKELGMLTIFPRLCSHEGASLDRACNQNSILHCPWHNKRVRPILVQKFEREIEFLYKNKKYKLFSQEENLKLFIT